MQIDPETELRVYLSGGKNYRDGVATLKPYKGNRDKSRKPVHAPALKEYVRRAYDAHISDGQEADDDMGIAHYTMWENDPDSTVIATIDKDLDMIPGRHYNFVRKEAYVIEPFEGLRNFYKQLLTGDTTDNIPGLRGVGPVKAAKLLDGPELTTESALWRVVSQEYRERHPEDWRERTLEIGRLLWITHFWR